MNILTNIPSSASVSARSCDGRLSAPAAEKNTGPITDLVKEYAPDRGQALEIASGTGQHIVKLAAVKPNLNWQPSDIDQLQIASIQSWCKDYNLVNVRPPVILNATKIGWSSKFNGQQFILLVNLIHLISQNEAAMLIGEISGALAPGGRSIIYGPFKRDNKLTSAGDQTFHQSLIEADPQIGYKNDAWIIAKFKEAKLELLKVAQMPANNLAFIFERPRM
jgi:hypothetical protein